MRDKKFKIQYDRPQGVWKYVIFVSLLSCIIILPYSNLLIGAFKDTEGNFTWKNWSFFLQDYELPFSKLIIPAAAPSMGVSFVFALGMAVLVLLISVPGAYCLSRTDYPGRRFLHLHPQIPYLNCVLFLLRSF